MMWGRDDGFEPAVALAGVMRARALRPLRAVRGPHLAPWVVRSSSSGLDSLVEAETETESRACAATRRWAAEFVGGLDLCPFAHPSLKAGTLRVVAATVRVPSDLDAVVDAEAARLRATTADAVASTLLVVRGPRLLRFPVFHRDVAVRQQARLARTADAAVCLAFFHPKLVFGDERGEPAAHYVGRAPSPTLHFLRVADLERAAATPIAPHGASC